MHIFLLITLNIVSMSTMMTFFMSCMKILQKFVYSNLFVDVCFLLETSMRDWVMRCVPRYNQLILYLNPVPLTLPKIIVVNYCRNFWSTKTYCYTTVTLVHKLLHLNRYKARVLLTTILAIIFMNYVHLGNYLFVRILFYRIYLTMQLFLLPGPHLILRCFPIIFILPNLFATHLLQI